MNLAVIILLILCGLLVVRLCKKYDMPLFVGRIFFPYRHEYVAKKWIDKELSYVSAPPYRPHVKFTDSAVQFIKSKSSEELSLQIILSHPIIGRMGAIPYAETRLGIADPNEDFVKLESSAGIPVLVSRKICNVLKQERLSLIVTTSGRWRFKKLKLRPDLSWLLYKEKMRGRGTRWGLP